MNRTIQFLFSVLLMSTLAAQSGFAEGLSVKYCALTPVNRTGKAPGNSYGHAVVWFDDTCLDASAKYPRLRRCSNSDPVKGVGLSVNKIFSNVVWLATPGHDLFFFGGLNDQDPIDKPTRDRLLKKAAELGTFRGIKMHPDHIRANIGLTLEEDMIDQSLDTDFAVNWGRDLICVNVPVTSKILDQAILYANLLNQRYSDPDEFNRVAPNLTAEQSRAFEIGSTVSNGGDFHWNAITQNCSHIAYNLIAATGLVPKKKVSSVYGRSVMTPVGGFNTILTRGNGQVPSDANSIASLMKNLESPQLLNQGAILPHEGVLVEKIAMHRNQNVLFKETRDLKGLSEKDLRERQASIKDSNFSDLRTNLQNFKAKYETALDKLMAGTSGNAELRDFAGAYASYLKARLNEIEQRLSHFDLAAESGSRP